MDRLKGKAAIVFGAGSSGPGWGNGKAAAVSYAREGARVACVDSSGDAAEETASIIRDEGFEAVALTADVTDLQSVREAAAKAVGAFGGIDILHNNVGVTHRGGPVELDEETFRAALDLNVGSVYRTAKAVRQTALLTERLIPCIELETRHRSSWPQWFQAQTPRQLNPQPAPRTQPES